VLEHAQIYRDHVAWQKTECIAKSTSSTEFFVYPFCVSMCLDHRNRGLRETRLSERCDKLSPSIITIAGEDSIRSCKNPNYPVLSRQMAAPDRTNSVTATKNSRHAACMLVVFPGFGTNLTWRFSFATFGAEINYRSQFCGLQLVANLN
jgi:hypothetical protein